MNHVVIQIVLIVAVLAFFAYYLRSRGSARSSALFKLLFIAFGLFAIYTVIRPNDLTAIANAMGVDRGTDLMLYALVVTFGFTTVGTYLRFREMEGRYTRLVRAVALQGAQTRTDSEWPPREDDSRAVGAQPHAPRTNENGDP